jgi:pimeloyl-ACP methyl ester carboxylesterase
MDGTARLFEPLLRLLPAGLAPIVAAYPEDRPYGYAELLPLIEAIVPDCGDFVVLGESFSGPLAILLAAKQPSGLRGVILCASFAQSPLPLLGPWLRPLVRPSLFRIAPSALYRRALLGRFDSPSLRPILSASLAGVQPAVLAARLRAILAVDVRQELQLCHVPILYLRATEDRLVSATSLARVRRLQPRAVEVALVGPHLLLQTAPEAAARAIQEFADRVAREPTPATDRPV